MFSALRLGLFAAKKLTQFTSVISAPVTAWLVLAAAGLLAGCGSGSVSPAPPPPPPNTSPPLSNFNPTTGTLGASVTLTGTKFTGATSVTIGGAPATFSVASATSATAIVPSAAITGKILLVTPQGTATSTNNFTVSVASPTLTNFSPANGSVGTTI